MAAAGAAAREAASAVAWQWLTGYELAVASKQEWPGPGPREGETDLETHLLVQELMAHGVPEVTWQMRLARQGYNTQALLHCSNAALGDVVAHVVIGLRTVCCHMQQLGQLRPAAGQVRSAQQCWFCGNAQLSPASSSVLKAYVMQYAGDKDSRDSMLSMRVARQRQVVCSMPVKVVSRQ